MDDGRKRDVSVDNAVVPAQDIAVSQVVLRTASFVRRRAARGYGRLPNLQGSERLKPQVIIRLRQLATCLLLLRQAMRLVQAGRRGQAAIRGFYLNVRDQIVPAISPSFCSHVFHALAEARTIREHRAPESGPNDPKPS